MTAPIKKFTKAPAELLDYTIDYSREMFRLGDTLASSTWIVPSNTVDHFSNTSIHLDDGVTVNYSENAPAPIFTQGGTMFTDTQASIYIAGGALGQEYVLENRIVTGAGRKYARRIAVILENKS